MNILIVADVSIAKVTGGAERVLYEQSTRLAKRGNNVHILTRRLPEHNSDMDVIEGVREWRFAFSSFNLRPFLKSTFLDCRQLFSHLHKKFSFNILNFHQPFTALGLHFSAGVSHIPRVYTCHSLSFEEFASRSSPPKNTKQWVSHRLQLFCRKLVEKTLLKRSDRIIVLSDYTKEKILRVYGLPESKIEIISGAVDLNRFRASEDKSTIRRRLGLPANRFILLSIRNLVSRMGLENLILALKLATEKRKDILLTLGGAGPLAEKLQDIVRNAGLDDFVRFTGFIPEKDLLSYYQMADLFVLPTKELEGFGMVTIEALASGLPVLGTPVGGTTEILTHMGPEFLFADSSPTSMAAQILKTIKKWEEDPKEYNEISKKCRHIAEHYYSWRAHIDRLEGLFQKMSFSAGKTGEAKRKLNHA